MHLDVQIKSLSNLGWFLSFGTFGQFFAAIVVVYKLVTSPRLGATTEFVHAGEVPMHVAVNGILKNLSALKALEALRHGVHFFVWLPHRRGVDSFGGNHEHNFCVSPCINGSFSCCEVDMHACIALPH